MKASRLILAVLSGALAALTLACAPALAAAPETPGSVSVEVRGTTARVRGVLNPAAEGEPGAYEFLYRASATECKGGAAAPAPPGMALGLAGEEVFEGLSGLQPRTQYTVCLLARNGKGEATVGPPTTFTTALRVEAPRTEPASEVTGATATLQGTLNPSNPGEPGLYQFLYRASATECQGEGEKFTERLAAAGHGAEAVSVPVAGLAAGTAYTFCLLAESQTGETAMGAPVTFTTSAVGAASVSTIGSTTATVEAQINPRGSPSGYRVEYVTEAQFQAHGYAEATRVPTPDAELAAASSPVAVPVQLTGLQPGTSYRARFVVDGELGTVQGADTAFTTTSTATAPSALLPDGRAYELVSAPTGGGEIYITLAPIFDESDHPTFRNVFRAAAGGNAVAYVADPSETAGNGGRGDGIGNQWLATRTATGWEAVDVTPAGEGETGDEAVETEYQGFSSDLSTGILTAQSPSLAREAQPQAPVGCTSYTSRPLYAHTGASSLQALFTGAETPKDCGAPLFAGASVDGSEVFFQSEARLTPQAAEVAGVAGGDRQGCTEDCDLYESVGGQLSLVNVLPDGTVAAGATFGGPPAFTSHPETTPPGLEGAVSADGSRAFWTDTQAGPDRDHIYLRESATSTVAVSAGAAEYWTATPDGHYAFYTEGGRLWRFDTERGTREALASEGTKGESAGVQGVIGASEDGSYVYFVAQAALAPGAESRRCVTAEAELGEREATINTAEETRLRSEIADEARDQLPAGRGCNVYLLHTGEAPRLVAALLVADDNRSQQGYFASAGEAGDWQPGAAVRTAQVAPDGQGMVFQSALHLTGYDSSALVGEHSSEVFVYEAAASSVFCVSCSPTGAPPIAESRESAGSYLPTHQAENDANATAPTRWISPDGSKVFFDTSQPLVPQDSNGLQDVYEWEREGASSCASQSSERPDGGCLFVLSGGESPDLSYLIGASTSGEDVFFSTRARLVSRETGDKSEIYDARADGGFPEYPLQCTGTGCQGVPAAPPIFATPSSVTFAGVGNFEPQPKASRRSLKCKLGRVKSRGRCVKRKAKKREQTTHKTKQKRKPGKRAHRRGK